MENNKSGLFRQVVFVRSVRNYFFTTGQIKTGLCSQETTTRRCFYEQVWLYTYKCINVKIRVSEPRHIFNMYVMYV